MFLKNSSDQILFYELYCCINAKNSHAITSSKFIVFWSYLAHNNSMPCTYLSGSRDKALFFSCQGIFTVFLVFLTQNHNQFENVKTLSHYNIFHLGCKLQCYHPSFTPLGNETLFFPSFCQQSILIQLQLNNKHRCDECYQHFSPFRWKQSDYLIQEPYNILKKGKLHTDEI